MTAPWNGLPDQPERSGWHWLAPKHRSDHWVMSRWNSDEQYWPDFYVTYPPQQPDQWIYGGPILNPSELAQMRKDERERAERGDGHDSDCAMHNEPAFPNGPCNCTKRDTERLDWLENQRFPDLRKFDDGFLVATDLICRSCSQATARAAIDAAMNAEKGQ